MVSCIGYYIWVSLRKILLCMPGRTWKSWSRLMSLTQKTVAVASGDGCIVSHGGPCYPCPKSISPHVAMLFSKVWGSLSATYPFLVPVPRIEVVLMDQNRRDPMYLGRWHIFLPSEMCLDCTLCNWYLLYTWNMCKYYGPWWLVTLNSFMDCMDCPGSMLCTLTMRTFSGRDGLDLLECQGCNILQSDML